MKLKKILNIRISERVSFIILLVLLAVLISLPFFTPGQYFLRTATNIGIYAILALSLNITTGYCGQVSMGQAAFMAVGAYTFAILNTMHGVGFFPAAFVGCCVAGVAGFILGMPTLRLSGAYFVIATTGFSEVVKVIALNWKSMTNGALGIKNIGRPIVFGFELTNANGGQYYIMLLSLAAVIWISYAIKTSKFGRALNAIRNDELASNLMGVNTSSQKVLAFVISAMLAGYAGVLYASMTRYIEPNTFTTDMSTIILCIVIFGGMGSIRGMIIGALLLISFPEILRFMATYRFIVYGLILILMMRFRPQGMLGGVGDKPYKLPKGVKRKSYEQGGGVNGVT